MKLNIACPATGAQKWLEIDDEKKLRALYDKRISQEVEGEALGEEFAGYVFRISGGNDKQGFPMKQGVLCNHRVKLLMRAGASCYRQRRAGERKRKSVRGCVVGPDLAVLNLVVVKQGEAGIEGLTDTQVPVRLGPKRANKIRKLFALSKDDDVRKYVIKRTFENKKGKEVTKPNATEVCKNNLHCKYGWRVSHWGECPAFCGYEMQIRHAFCEREDGQEESDRNCARKLLETRAFQLNGRAASRLDALQALGISVEIERPPSITSRGGRSWQVTFVNAPHDLPLLTTSDVAFETTSGAALHQASVAVHEDRPGNGLTGTFTLCLGGAVQTPPIPHDATAEEMREALETLPTVAAVGVTRSSATTTTTTTTKAWSGPSSGASLEGGYAWTVTFFAKGRHDARLGTALNARSAGTGGDVPSLVANTSSLSSTLGFQSESVGAAGVSRPVDQLLQILSLCNELLPPLPRAATGLTQPAGASPSRSGSSKRRSRRGGTPRCERAWLPPPAPRSCAATRRTTRARWTTSRTTRGSTRTRRGARTAATTTVAAKSEEIQDPVAFPGADNKCRCNGLEHYHCPEVTSGFAHPTWCDSVSYCRNKPHPLARMRINSCEHGQQVWCAKDGARCMYESEAMMHLATEAVAASATSGA